MSRIFNSEIRVLQDEDLRSRLIFIGEDTSRDGSGKVFRFEISISQNQETKFFGKVLVGEITSLYADRHFEKTVPDYQELRYLERKRLYNKYEEAFGKVLNVKEFESENFEIKNISSIDFSQIRDNICALLLKRLSTFDLNSKNPPSDGHGFYDDKLEFSPSGGASKYKKTYLATEVLG